MRVQAPERMPPRDKHLVAKALAIALAQMRREAGSSDKGWQAADMERILRGLLESDAEFSWFMEAAGQIVEGKSAIWTPNENADSVTQSRMENFGSSPEPA